MEKAYSVGDSIPKTFGSQVCDQCGAQMACVGREIKPGHPEIWMEGWVFPKRRCPGYMTSDYQNSTSRWPALTLMGIGIHLCISGALKFRDAQKS